MRASLCMKREGRTGRTWKVEKLAALVEPKRELGLRMANGSESVLWTTTTGEVREAKGEIGTIVECDRKIGYFSPTKTKPGTLQLYHRLLDKDK